MRLPQIASTRTDRAQHVEEAFSEGYFEFQYRFVEFFVEHLGDVSRAFNGDLQQMLMLALVGQVKLRAVHAAIEAGDDPASAVRTRAGITASRLADITAVPRETVRRKLAQLSDHGWVEQYADGTWGIAANDGDSRVRRDLAEIDRRGMLRVARLFSDLERIVDSHGERGADQEGRRNGEAP